MNGITFSRARSAVLLAMALAVPGVSMGYDNRDAIRDCEAAVRNEYGLMDLRESRAMQLSDGRKRYRVEGKTKVNGDKYPWYCEIDDRRVVDTGYRGPRRDRDREGRERPDAPPQIVPRRGGDVEVRLAGGCRAVFDRDGELTDRSRDCSRQDLRRAETAAQNFQDRRRDHDRRDYRDDDGGYREEQSRDLPMISVDRNGEGRAKFKNGCVVFYDRVGRNRDARPECRDRQVMQADRAMREYRREEGL